MRKLIKTSTLIKTVSLILVFLAAISFAQPASNPRDSASLSKNESGKQGQGKIDPFLAGALGFIPYFSGFYISKTPERGIVFSLVDILLTLGIYTSLHSKSGDPDHVPVYYTFMGINNIVDGYYSTQAAINSGVNARLGLKPQGGFEYVVAWTF